MECVDNPTSRNQVIKLGQSQTASMLKVVRIFEKIAGRSFELLFVSEAALAAQRAATMDPLQVSFVTMMLNMAHGIQVDTKLAEKLFACPLASVEDYAGRVLG